MRQTGGYYIYKIHNLHRLYIGVAEVRETFVLESVARMIIDAA